MNKRRSYLVNKEVQLRFAALLVFISLITAVLLVASIAFLDNDVIQQAGKFGLADNQVLVSFIILQQKNLLLRLISMLVINMILVALFGFFFSHRIAGPVYHMEKFLKKVAEGDLSGTLRIRKHDQFQSLAATINLMMECLRQKRRDELDTMKTLHKQITATGGKNTEALNLLDSLCRQCEADLFSPAAAAHKEAQKPEFKSGTHD